MIKLRNLLILLAVLVALGVSYFVLSKTPGKTAKTSTTDTIQITSTSQDKISTITLSSTKGTILLIKSDDVWKVKDKSYVLNQDTITSISNVFTNLTATKVVESSPKDLSVYGLDKPSYVATATTTDNKNVTINVGLESAISGTYYVMVQGKNDVYAVSDTAITTLFYSVSDMRDKSLTSIDTSKLMFVSIAQKNKAKVEIVASVTKATSSTESDVTTYKLTQPYAEPQDIDSNNLTSFFSAISTLGISDFVDDNPTNLSKYGLDKPESTIMIGDDSSLLTLYIGNVVNSNYYYFRTEGSKAVYTIDKENVDALRLDPFNIINRAAYITNIDNVSKIVITKAGVTNVIDITKTVTKAKTDNDSDTTTYSFKVNGKAISQDDGIALYQKIIGLEVDSSNFEKVKTSPDIKMIFTFSSGNTKEQEIDYVTYNENFYSVVKNGVHNFLISKSKLNDIINSIIAIK